MWQFQLQHIDFDTVIRLFQNIDIDIWYLLPDSTTVFDPGVPTDGNTYESRLAVARCCCCPRVCCNNKRYFSCFGVCVSNGGGGGTLTSGTHM